MAGEQKARAEMVRELLLSRGIEVSARFLADSALANAPGDLLVSAALACEDEATYLAAIARSER